MEAIIPELSFALWAEGIMRGRISSFLSRFRWKTLRRGPGKALRAAERVRSSKTPLMVKHSLLRLTFEKPRLPIHRYSAVYRYRIPLGDTMSVECKMASPASAGSPRRYNV